MLEAVAVQKLVVGLQLADSMAGSDCLALSGLLLVSCLCICK